MKSSPLFCKWRKLRTKEGEGNRRRHHSKRHYPGFKPSPPLSVLVTNILLCFSSLLPSHLVDRSHVLHWGGGRSESTALLLRLSLMDRIFLDVRSSKQQLPALDWSEYLRVTCWHLSAALLLLWRCGLLHLLVY